MFEIYRPEKDSTIYEYEKEANTGIDEILELNTVSSDDGENYLASRILMQFSGLEEQFNSFVENGPNVFASYGYKTVNRSLSTPGPQVVGNVTFNVLKDQITEGPDNGVNTFAFFGQRLAPKREQEADQPEETAEEISPAAWLRLWFAEGQGLPKKYTLEALPVEKEWKEGRGRFDNIPKTIMPVSWIERTDDKDWQSEGGDYADTPRAAEIFDGEDPDVYMDLTPALSNGLKNGFLLKRKNEGLNRLSELRFFSSNTCTIYVPQLLVGTDSYEFQAGDASPVETEEFVAYVSDMNEMYRPRKTRLYVSVEEKYEQRDFLGRRPTEVVKPVDSYLPKRSLTYKIEDVRTGLTMIPFDENYSAVSFNGKTHYIDVNFKNFFPKREYKITFKYTDPDTGVQELFDYNQTFKVSYGTEF